MKKLLLILLTVMMSISSLTLSAQSMLTVANGTATNSYVPVYGLYVDDFVRCQTIYPASMIAGLNGETILGLTYYLSTPADDSWGVASFVVKVLEVPDTTLTAFVDMTNATTVYSGSLDATQSTMEISFTAPYTYQGGNLLIEIYNTLEGTYESAYFYGISATGASWQGNNGTSVDNITGAVRDFIPKTTFLYGNPPTCFKVSNQNIDATQTTSSSLTITWTDLLNTGATYNIYDMSDSTLIVSGVTGTSYTVSNLNANTAYSFGIETDCGDGDIALGYALVSGRTACAALPLPWTCGFEADEIVNTTQATALPWCSQRYVSAATSGTSYPYSYSGSTYAHAGSRSLYFYGTTSSSYPDTMAIILPEVDVNSYPMNGNRITFWARMSSTSYNKYVHVLSLNDPNDFSTATLVDSVLVSGTTHVRYSVPLTAATSSNAYLALMVKKGSGTVYLDDVTIEEMPSCVEVSNITTSDITSSSVTLHWVDASNTGATYTIYNMADTSVVGTANDTTYTVDNLSSNTDYTFGVQANCSAGDAPIMTVDATTACGVETMPWSENFDNWFTKSPCWSFLSGLLSEGNPTPSTSAWTLSSSYGDFITISGKALAMNLYSSNRYWAVTPPINITSNDAMFSVDVAVAAWSDAQPNYDGNDTLAFLISTDNGATYTILQVFDSVQLNNLGNSYTTLFAPASGYEGQTVRFAIYGGSISGTSPYDNRIVIDNVTVGETPSCMPVSNLSTSNISAYEATLTWVGEADSYTIYNMADTSVIGTTYDTTYTIDNLDANTFYTFGVQANCTSGDAAIVNISFFTSCIAFAAPYTWDFEAMNANAAPQCWTKVGAGTVNVLSSTSNSHGGSHYVRFSGSTSNLIALPETQDEISTLQLRFWTRPESYTTTSCGTFSVGYLTDVTDASTFVEVANYVYSDFSAYDEKTVTFAGAPTGARMAMRHNAGSTSWYWYIDDVTIEEAPSCLPVTGLTATNITETSATLTWNGNATNYNVYDMSDSTFVTSVNTTSYDLTGLTAMTSYTYGIAADCGGDESPIITVTFTTACSALALPYTETFETSSNAVGCWTVVGDGSWGIGVGDYSTSTGAYEGSYNAKITHNVTGNTTMLISPVLDGVQAGLTLDFAYVMRAWVSDIDELRVYFRTAADAAWQQVAEYTTEAATWTTSTVVIPGTVYQIAFEHTDNYGYGVGLDSIVFTASSAPEVDTLHVTLTINDATLGTITPAVGNYDLFLGDTLMLTATPNADANFDGWKMYFGGQAITLPINPYPLVVNPNLLSLGDITVTAMFSDSTSAPDSLTIILNTADATMGTTDPAPGVHSYAVGEQSTLTALPNPGYEFLYWIESVTVAGMTMSDTLYPPTISMVVNPIYAGATLEITAYFQPSQGEPCDAPTGVSVSAFDDQSISLVWDNNANVESWNVRYRAQSGDWTTVVANTNSYTITGLAQNTTYQMQVQSNCGDGILSQWSATVTQTTTGLNSYLENNISLYPNPANDYIDVRVDELNVTSMEVYDVYGKLINNVSVVNNPTRINVSGLATGMYFVRVTTEQGVATKSFIKK